jgi:hypothetical protein
MERSVLQEKLSQPFDAERWKDIVEGVFHNVQYWAKERELLADDGIVDRFVEKGTVQLKDGKNLALFEVRVADSVNLPRARVKLRNLVAKYIDQESHYGVLAIFDQGGEDYRLSFVAKESELVDGEFLTKETPAKRYTYLLGSNESCRTAAERLSALSLQEEASLDDIINAFSVEKLNKEFYRDIQKHFYRLVGGKVDKTDFTGCLALPSCTPEDSHQTYQEFAVRLIGRVIFCWFLKHKRCDKDRPLIPDELLSSKAVGEHAGYYHEILEKLFFQTLNKPMNERSKYAPEFAHLIPYLNGGLFDPKPHDYYEEGAIGASLYINTLQIPDDWFLNLLECLERYNFTIDENTSLDNDVSIDPEILGRIFENLLAEINPETGDSARKSTGSFYTPREIVDYMVEESLVQHLKTSIMDDEQLETQFRALLIDDDNPHGLDEDTRKAVVDSFRSIKVLDPACGSGAFPVGILQKMLCALRKVDPDNDLWLDAQINVIHTMKLNHAEESRRLLEIEHAFETNEADYGRKLGIIQNSVYGVDIQPVAIEIAKLRFFLTLVVDEKINDEEENRGILPLPNLDFKFVAANTLIPAPEMENNGELDLEYYPEFFDVFTSLSEQYFYAGTPVEKKRIREALTICVEKKVKGELNKVQDIQGNDLLENINLSERKKKQIALVRSELIQNIILWRSYGNIFTGDTIGFFDPKYMFPDAAEGFDVVIANPPYVQIQKLPETVKEQLKGVGYSSFGKTADLYCLFYERGLQSLRPDGVLTFISSNKFFRAGYGKGLRKLLNEEKELQIIIDFGELPVFEAGTDPCIISVVNHLPSRGEISAAIIKEKKGLQNVSWTVNETGFEMNRDGLVEDGWTLDNPNVINLLDKLRASGTPLGEYVGGKFYYGIKTGYNEAFVINSMARDLLIAEDPKVSKVLKPWLRGKDIRRWHADSQDLWLINTHTGYGNTSAIDIDEYPVLKAYLDSIEQKRVAGEFGEKAKKAKGLFKREDQGKTAYNLRNCVYVPEFERPKIMYPVIGKEPRFLLCEEGYFSNDKSFIIPSSSLFLLGILNSSLNWFYLKQVCTSHGDPNNGGRLELRGIYMDKVPVPSATPAQQSEIEERVKKIMAMGKENPETGVTALEGEIDELVYKLYDLTPEEIAIVEGAK